MNTRFCSSCKKDRPITEFFESRKAKDGFYYWCKTCATEYRRKWRKKNKEQSVSLDFTGKEKECPRCKKVKPFSEFHKNHGGKDNHASYCKTCERAKSRMLHAKHMIEHKSLDYSVEKTLRCRVCKQEKSSFEFGKYGGSSTGYDDVCKSCRKIIYRETRYNLDSKAIASLLKKQNNKCVICHSVLTDRFHVDHSHLIGNVRGLLCQNCNHGLGNFMDSPDILRSAAIYLENASKREVSNDS